MKLERLVEWKYALVPADYFPSHESMLSSNQMNVQAFIGTFFKTKFYYLIVPFQPDGMFFTEQFLNLPFI